MIGTRVAFRGAFGPSSRRSTELKFLSPQVLGSKARMLTPVLLLVTFVLLFAHRFNLCLSSRRNRPNFERFYGRLRARV